MRRQFTITRGAQNERAKKETEPAQGVRDEGDEERKSTEAHYQKPNDFLKTLRNMYMNMCPGPTTVLTVGGT